MLWSAFKQTTASIKWRLAPELECFQNLKKLRKQCLSFSPLGNRIQEGKKGWDNLPEVFLSLADCRSKHEMTHWTAGTTWQRVSAQPQTAQTRGNQSLFSMHGLPLKLSCHQPHAQCPDPPPTGEPAEATVTTALDTSDSSLQSRWDNDGVINHYHSFGYHWNWASKGLCG